MNLKKIPHYIPIFGDIEYRGFAPLEDDEHITSLEWLKIKHKPLHDLIVHPKSEGKRTWQQIAKEKKMGLSKGRSDFIIPASPAFCCELKRKDHTRSEITSDQISYLVAAHNLGSFACIGLGFDGFRLAIDEYVRHKNSIDNQYKKV